MLENLHVKNLALIDEIEVDFQPGLNILTGETGAGKSILLGSVNLALGGRFHADMLRTGAKFGLVELTFTIDSPSLEEQLTAMDIFPEDGRIVLSRKLMPGRSVSKINGETVSMAALKDVASMLIDIHGQHEHQSLLHKKNHLAFLDLYAKDQVEKLKKDTAKAFRTYHGCRKKLDESGMDERERQKEISLAEFEVNEIEEAGLFEGEDEEVEALYRRMSAGKKVAQRIAEAYHYTSEDESGNASELLSRAIHALSDVESVDEQGAGLYGQLIEIDSLLNDFNRELSEYAKSLDFSEEEFYGTENRLNELNRLKTKYGNSAAQVLEYCEERKQRLKELEDYEQYMQELEEQLKASRQDYEKHALALRKARKKAAVSFVKEIKKGLSDMNFLDVRFEMRFLELPDYTSDGMDEAEFYISTNPGEDLRPMGNVASGGELSRIMLAIKTVLADREDTPTLIFDEIDTGISGITAGKVAEKMHIIGESRQVLCITHLAQIAAQADAHYLIQKRAKNNGAQTEIFGLEEEESVQELARLLGGAKVTASILESAREMKR
ncbi:MAG: DNA repair protein RecN [Ruminococcus sp.]|uniref:DNA repair protein RecN n=1 Tax=Schaedlerella arabinosiphila TaxID=2044587 RepID=A0A426DGQ2_9FIRM|nr:DNA repair protein RecN [Schaedlerella arabinosiphila]MCI8723316.1 DNA repair protein RecN [Ruminococcus sp.]MCI9213398.1 DNA repair protein RecN [Ruminococcus sp.]MCI9603647.1 DNA repair protein RecN [Ruminococcus sp.]MCI9632525.1 DNA repair protein RecN [Ruminococcus sp.]RRK31793.1 DNA repair protein RecN [Schaedlerella arabinosiphila]